MLEFNSVNYFIIDGNIVKVKLLIPEIFSADILQEICPTVSYWTYSSDEKEKQTSPQKCQRFERLLVQVLNINGALHDLVPFTQLY